jgi:outer membrane protein OmpA-like peptidoglycan-associated protein
MNAINITIGGLIASIFFIFLCISLNAEQYYKELTVHPNVEAVAVKPMIVLRDRSSNTLPKVDITHPVPYKPIVSQEENCTRLKHKEENVSSKKMEVLRAVKEPLSEQPTVYLLSENNVSENNLSESNLSSSQTIVENIQDKISTLLEDKKITFKKNSGKLSREGKEVLDKLIALLSNQKGFTIEIQGHTDAGGKKKVNQWISQMRANRVKKYLLQKGLSSENIQAKGFGESQLLFSDKPYSQKNRRVEIYIKRRKNVSIND